MRYQELKVLWGFQCYRRWCKARADNIVFGFLSCLWFQILYAVRVSLTSIITNSFEEQNAPAVWNSKLFLSPSCELMSIKEHAPLSTGMRDNEDKAQIFLFQYNSFGLWVSVVMTKQELQGELKSVFYARQCYPPSVSNLVLGSWHFLWLSNLSNFLPEDCKFIPHRFKWFHPISVMGYWWVESFCHRFLWCSSLTGVIAHHRNSDKMNSQQLHHGLKVMLFCVKK